MASDSDVYSDDIASMRPSKRDELFDVIYVCRCATRHWEFMTSKNWTNAESIKWRTLPCTISLKESSETNVKFLVWLKIKLCVHNHV